MVAEIDRRQKLLREKEEFNLERLFDWAVYGALHDGASIIDKEKFELLHPSKWPDQRQRRLIDSIKFVTRGEGRSKVSTIEVKFAARHQFFDRIALLMGVSKKIDLKVEDGGRAIPLSVIDAITERWAPEARKAGATSAPAQARRLSTAEMDAINQDSDEPREAGEGS